MPVGQLIDMTVNRTANNTTNAADKPAIATKVLPGQDPFSINYSGISNLDPIVISNKNISKKEKKQIITQETTGLSSTNAATWSSEIDPIAETEAYNTAMAPLIKDMKDSVRDATNKAARTIGEVALFAAPIPYIPGTATAVRFGSKLMRPVSNFASPVVKPVISTIKNKIVNPVANSNFGKLMSNEAKEVGSFFGVGNSGTSTLSHSAALNARANWSALRSNSLIRASIDPTFAVKHQILPELKKTTSAFQYFNPTQKQNIETWTKILSSGADTMKTARAAEIAALSSGEGFKRLVGLERGFIDTAWRAQRGNITGKGLQIEKTLGSHPIFSINYTKTIPKSEFGAAAANNARLRLKELSVPSVNESLSTLLNSQGKLNFKNFKKAQNIIMQSPRGTRHLTNHHVGSDLPYFSHNAFASAGYNPSYSNRLSIISQRFSYDKGKVALGTGNLKSLNTAEHELGHMLQKGYPTNLDKYLVTNVKPKRNIWTSPQGSDYAYFSGGETGRRITEAMPFAKEFRNTLQQQNLISSRYQKMTPGFLEGIKNKLKTGGGLSGGTRIYDFMKKSSSNFGALADGMNKLPAFAPVIGLGGLSTLGGGNK